MGTLEVDKLDPQSGTALEIGTSGDTVTVPSGVTLTVAGALNVTGTTALADGTVNVAELDIDGATDIGEAIVDADLFVIDNGAGGTNRKTAASRLTTYILGANSIDSDMYVDGSIDAAHMSANSIDSASYVDGSIDNAHIADDAIDSEHYADLSIDTAHIGALQVTGAKLNTDVISAQTALASEPADTDEFMVSDAGVLKRIDYSLIKGSGTHVKLVSGSASSAVNQDFQSFMDTSKYNTYMVEFSNLVGLQGNTFDFQFLQSDNSVSGAGYWGSVQGMRSSGNAYADNYENVAQGELGSALDTSASTVGAYLFWIYNNPNSTTYGSSVYGQNWGYRADWSDYIYANFTIGFNNSNSVHGFRVHAAGNDATTFDYAIYGIAK